MSGRGRAATFLVALGSLVGLVVAIVSVAAGASLCGAGEGSVGCYELTRTLAIRTGVLAGLATVIMGALVAGLLRMLSQGERDAAERAREQFLAARRGTPFEE